MSAPAYMTECVPEPVYGCKEESCAEAVSYPAEDLRYFAGHDAGNLPAAPSGWYCEEHRDELRLSIEAEAEESEAGWVPNFAGYLGPTLAEELQRRHAEVLEDIVAGAGY